MERRASRAFRNVRRPGRDGLDGRALHGNIRGSKRRFDRRRIRAAGCRTVGFRAAESAHRCTARGAARRDGECSISGCRRRISSAIARNGGSGDAGRPHARFACQYLGGDGAAQHRPGHVPQQSAPGSGEARPGSCAPACPHDAWRGAAGAGAGSSALSSSRSASSTPLSSPRARCMPPFRR